MTYPFRHDPHGVVNPSAEQIANALERFSSIGGSLLGDIWLKRSELSQDLLFYVHSNTEAVVQRTCQNSGEYGSQFLVGDRNKEGALVVYDPGVCDLNLSNRNLVPLADAIHLAKRFADDGYYGDDLDWEDMTDDHV